MCLIGGCYFAAYICHVKRLVGAWEVLHANKFMLHPIRDVCVSAHKDNMESLYLVAKTCLMILAHDVYVFKR